MALIWDFDFKVSAIVDPENMQRFSEPDQFGVLLSVFNPYRLIKMMMKCSQSRESKQMLNC
ncbi:hypothetical protein Leryth_021207 [Lithospermum erythrorhizon]|nr:hypothetical protein Leryth_021207 [Lithospermum erythrorhizon]